MLGSSDYHAIDWSVPKAEIGYWVTTPHTGQGYALETARTLTALALALQSGGGLGLHRLEIRCDTSNHRSRRIPEQLGYTLEATLKNDDRSADGSELRDTLIFSRLA